jgi:hypothetical protein
MKLLVQDAFHPNFLRPGINRRPCERPFSAAKSRRSKQINLKRPTFRKLRARTVGAARSSVRHAPGRHRLHHGAADG